MLLKLMEISRATALQLRAGALTRCSALPRRSVHDLPKQTFACQRTSSKSISRLSPWIRNIVIFLPMLYPHIQFRGLKQLATSLLSQCESTLSIIVRCLFPSQNLSVSRSQLVQTSPFTNVNEPCTRHPSTVGHNQGLLFVCAHHIRLHSIC